MNEKLVGKIISYIHKYKFNKVDRILSKNRNNEQLFEELLNYYEFQSYLENFQMQPEIFSKLNINIQKKIIDYMPSMFRHASDELRDDKEYIVLMEQRLNNSKIKNKYINSFYSYIGPKLSRDKEFLISIQDTSPLAFLHSINKLDYPIELIKDFFNKYPEYVASLPDKLKYDFEYVSSLIEKIPSQSIELVLYSLDYEYLKLEQIKSAIIRNAGENAYGRILLFSLSENQKQLKNVTHEEFKKLILLAPETFYDINKLERFRNLGIGGQNDNFKLIGIINKTSKLTFNEINNPQKFTDVLFELSSAIGYKLSYEQINNQVKNNWVQILPWIEQIDENHMLDNGKIAATENPIVFRKIYNILLGIENNKLDDMFKIFINSELRGSEFADGIKNITVNDNNISFLQLACNTNLFNCNQQTIEMYNKLFLIVSKWNNDPYNTINFISKLSRDRNLYNLLLSSNIENLDQNLLLNVYNYVETGMNVIYKITNLKELVNFEDLINQNIDKLRAFDIKNKKHKTLLKHFQINMFRAEKILHSYLNSSNDSELYKNMPEALYLNQMLEKIVNISEEKELNEIEKQLQTQNVVISFKDIEQIISKIKISYGNEINNSLFKVKETNGTYDITNLDFNLLVHVIGAYGDVPTGDIYESWNTTEKTSKVSICTSFISDNNLGIAPTNEHSVVLGFNNLPNNYLELMSSQDLYSRGFSAERSSKFMTSEELKNNTRHGHNELVIRRRKGDFTEEKVEPSYIICFDNINEESKIAAEKFGVPILFIDREKVAERKHNEIVNMIKDFQNTLDPHLISKIICEQENNKAGLRLVRPDLVEKYFSTEFRQNNIETLYSIINEGIINNNDNAITSMNEFVQTIEKEKEKFKTTKETPHRKNTFDLKYDEFIAAFKINPQFSDNFELPKKLTEEELYQKFLECREKLTQKERVELQYLNSKNISVENNLNQGSELKV